MTRSSIIRICMFLAGAIWAISGAGTQMLMGVAAWSDYLLYLGIAIGAGVTLLVIGSVITNALPKSFTSERIQGQRLLKVLTLSISLVVIGIGAIASYVSYQAGKSQMISSNQVRTIEARIAERERVRQASLTPQQKEQEEEAKAEAAKHAADQAKEVAQKKAQDAQAENTNLTIAEMAVGQIRRSTRNPESFVLEHAFYTEPDNYICIDYRGQNGFGGYSKEFVVVTPAKKIIANNPSLWNAKCANKTSKDMTYAVANLGGMYH